jgi:two-component system sensor histidine kinase PilS (NtrC family)
MEPLEKLAVRMMVYRMVVVLTFFTATLGIQAFVGGEATLKPFYFLIALVLGLNVLHAALFSTLKHWRGAPILLYVQLIGDVLSVTLLAFLTGGITSVFTFLYQVLVVVAGLVLRRRGAFTVAWASALAFGTLCVALTYGFANPTRFSRDFPYDQPSIESALYALTAQYVGLFLVAALVAVILGRMEKARHAIGVLERDLFRTRTFTDQLVSSLAWGVLTTDAEGVVTFANPAGMRLMGETLPGGWSFRDALVHLGHDGDPLRDLPPSGQDLEVSLPGSRHLGISVAPLKSGKGDSGHLVILRDQTEMVRLREQLALKDRLMVTGAVAADIAHEIKNPLGSISGSAQMLRRQAPEGSSEAALLTIIHEESRRLSDILSNFLRYVKPPPLQLLDLDLSALTHDVVTLFKNDPACGPDVEVTARIPDRTVVIQADADRVKQALWNLLNNARKAIPADGRIGVALWEEDRRAILEVEDNGMGMAPSEIQSYFQPFRKGFAQGFGLGLPQVFQILEQHGGRVEMTSSPGKGTRCRLIFPAEGPHA